MIFLTLIHLSCSLSVWYFRYDILYLTVISLMLLLSCFLFFFALHILLCSALQIRHPDCLFKGLKEGKV